MSFALPVVLPLAISLAWLVPALWPSRNLSAHWCAAEVVALSGGLLVIPLLFTPTPMPWFAAAELMQALIQVLAWLVLRYAHRYMRGEPGQARFLRAMGCLLAAVTVVVQADHLVLMALAWIACSLALQTLLSFYPTRLAAQRAARREWRASRFAELLLLAALLLWSHAGGSFSLQPSLHPSLLRHQEAVAAGLLLAAAVAIKTAQLPFHGWLIQVMEAPTPISALLHAGVVNLGGMVLIKAAVLLQASPAARILLIMWGGSSALLCCVVMLTRISIKLHLAWSTSAQMGFMLLEIGMGYDALALLHLLAHSFYKAHAFLLAGETVRHSATRQLLGAAVPGPLFIQLARGLLEALLLASVQGLCSYVGGGAGLAPLCCLAIGLGLGVQLGSWRGVLVVLALSLSYGCLHRLASMILPQSLPVPADGVQVLLASMFLAVFVLQTWLLGKPQGRLARRLYAHAYAGFHLDEVWTLLSRYSLGHRTCRRLPVLQLQESHHD